MATPDSDPGRHWGLLGLAGVLGVCCLSFSAIIGGGAVAGTVVGGVTVTSGTVTSLGGFLVAVLATALPLVVIGVFISRRLDAQ